MGLIGGLGGFRGWPAGGWLGNCLGDWAGGFAG